MTTALTPLRLDPGCTNRANWCCRIDGSGEAERVEDGMAERGYGSHSRHPALKVFRRGGRELAWVVSTGRVQVRVPMTVATELRERAAQNSWRDLAASLGQPDLTPGPTPDLEDEGGPP